MEKKTIDPCLLIALIAGIVFFAIGIYLTVQGVTAEGSIDIQSTILSGKITAGSAGLFVLFFSFFIIVFSLLIGRHITFPSSSSHDAQEMICRRASRVFYTLIFVTVLLVFGVVFFPTEKKFPFVFAAAGFGFLTLMAFIWYSSILESSINKNK